MIRICSDTDIGMNPYPILSPEHGFKIWYYFFAPFQVHIELYTRILIRKVYLQMHSQV